MTTEPTGHGLSPVAADAAQTLKELPTRRPADLPTESSPLQWHLVDMDRYEITRAGRTLGYVDVVGAVFVVLAGRRYSRAVEVAQTLVFDTALTALHGSHRGHSPQGDGHLDCR